MPSVQNPAKGLYSQTPDDELSRCPHCNKILNQHAVVGVRQSTVPVDVNRNSSGAIHLFSQPAPAPAPAAAPAPAPAPAAAPAPAPTEDLEAVARGDLYAPKIAREFELVTTGQARPHKRETHVIPGMARRQASPPPTPQVMNHPNADILEVLDHPLIGGKLTVCVLLYGEEHHALHRRCLTSIVTTVPPSRMDLRVACNQVGLETSNFLNSLPITKRYEDYKNRRKYPAMRQMFWDESCPITTPFVVWFDDDSFVLNEQWLAILGQTIVTQRPTDKVGMYGSKMYHPLQANPNGRDAGQWFKNAKWYRGKNFQDKRGREAPNGDKIHFAVGGFWCISLEAMKACDIPDTRLNHNGGDITVGEQIHQGGYKVKQFNENKQYIKTSGAPRRGFKEKFPFYL